MFGIILVLAERQVGYYLLKRNSILFEKQRERERSKERQIYLLIIEVNNIIKRFL